MPWETFRNDANLRHQDLYRAFESLRPRIVEGTPLTAIVDTPLTFLTVIIRSSVSVCRTSRFSP